MTSPDWTLFRAFAAALRHGSLTAAASSLGMSQPTLSRRIASLEAQLGYALFTRSPEGLTPTAEAETLRPEAEALEAAAEAMHRAASNEKAEAAGTVRLTASEVVAAEVLPRAIARCRAKLPALVVDVLVSNRLEDLLRREADIAIRMTRPEQDGLIGCKIGDVELGLFAHPSYLAGRPAPGTAAELEGHALVGFDTPLAYTRVLQIDGRPLGRERFCFRSDSDMAQLGAIRAGIGIGVCHLPLADGLVRILPESFAPRVEVWLATHADMMRTPRHRLLFRTLADELRHYGAASGGTVKP